MLCSNDMWFHTIAAATAAAAMAVQAATYICEYQDYLNFHLTGRMVASISNVSVRWHYNSSRGEANFVWAAAAGVRSQQQQA